MWYFSWILGTGLACFFAILNAIWLELRIDASTHTDSDLGDSVSNLGSNKPVSESPQKNTSIE